MFVVASDFDLPPYSIPNLDKVPNTFGPYVDQHEEEILISLLGASFYNSFIEGLEEDPIPEKWSDLRDGADYIIDTHTYKWKGMKNMLVPFIYSEWLSDTFDTLTGVGVVVGNPENSIARSPSARISRAWNQFAQTAGTYMPNYRSEFQYGLYPDWAYFDGQSCHDMRDTLYGYLKQNGISGTFDGTFDDTFTDFQTYLNFWFKDPGTKNVFNI